jgi:hypothetical protein
MLAFLILARPEGDSASALMSFTTLDRSADLAVLVDDPGLLFAGRAEANELHGFSPLL